MRKRNCYIYTRVSTSMQVDGFSLDAQKDKLRKSADYQDMHIAGEYTDEGKSGKNIGGRPDFQKMLDDIASGKDNIDFVLVFKLSRFGRNAADVLSSLQIMQDYGVNLICVEDGIDSSKDSGKLMISVLSAVAEIERENILVQTMEGRKQKAREGKWIGGFAPYGYKLVDGELKIADDEAEIIRIIYDKFIHTTMGANAVARYLNRQGYMKKKRQNGTFYRDYWYYACKHRLEYDGHKCTYKKQIHQDKVNDAVIEVVRHIVQNSQFDFAIKEKLEASVNLETYEKEESFLKMQIKQLTIAKERLGVQMDRLDYSDKYYEQKYSDMQTRMDSLYDEIAEVKVTLESVQMQISGIRERTNIKEHSVSFPCVLSGK